MQNPAPASESPETDQEPASLYSADDFQGPEPDPEEKTILEMRQIAGLTAGTVMPLHVGLFQFRESEKDIGFSLAVQDANNVAVIPGSAAALIDQMPVEQPMTVGSAVLNVGSACFIVRPPRPAPTSAETLKMLEANFATTSAITVPEFNQDESFLGPSISSYLRLLLSEEGEELYLTAESWEFLETIRERRDQVSDRHRQLHPDAERLQSRLRRMDPGLWERNVNHSTFGRFAVSYCAIPWEPRFDAPENIPEALYEPIEKLSVLPWVPVTANLLHGPLGIVGNRSAALACARHAVLSLAALTAPGDIEFSIVTSKTMVEDWNWTRSLPSSLFPTGTSSYCVALADGLSHFESAGFSHDAVKQNEMGLIVLGESIDEMPDYCGTVLQIRDDGTCQVTNHLGERVEGTPIGVSTALANEGAAMISAATEEPENGSE